MPLCCAPGCFAMRFIQSCMFCLWNHACGGGFLPGCTIPCSNGAFRSISSLSDSTSTVAICVGGGPLGGGPGLGGGPPNFTPLRFGKVTFSNQALSEIFKGNFVFPWNKPLCSALPRTVFQPVSKRAYVEITFRGIPTTYFHIQTTRRW